jgi:ribokinase
VLLCQLEVPLDATAEALGIAHRAGVATILNAAPVQPLPDSWFKQIGTLIVNETELRQLVRMPVESSEQMEKAAKRLWNKGPGSVLVTLGEEGVMGVGKLQSWRESAIRVKAVDTTGAGDAFIGALAVDLGRRPWVEIVKRAMAIAALTVTRPGTQSSYPTRREAEAFLREHGIVPNSGGSSR